MYPRYFNKVDKTQLHRPLRLLPTLAYKQKPPWGYSLTGVGACNVQAQSPARYFIWRKVLGGCAWVAMATEGQCSWACRPHVCSIMLQKGDLEMQNKT